MSRSKPVTESAAFQRAFVALGYFVDRRGAELLEPLEAPTSQAQELVRRLSDPSRDVRAQALAGELSRLVASLQAHELRA